MKFAQLTIGQTILEKREAAPQAVTPPAARPVNLDQV
jgi:hypothetical protein